MSNNEMMIMISPGFLSQLGKLISMGQEHSQTEVKD